ncbi:acetate--CoA ligase family protein [Variovorax sp. PDNC026]|uniref:acetate--CoA ligase family protein n=1 Tax=Variovorax sp. PDNC026 TaxID=2811425 RepID=UPI00196600AE|nr:acetate--CoA ligase family protein [Variovorax sp. PDNC026]QRY31858.1 acetate--CoA ligase family protein [Variovorax sp. PDNC026]
MQAIRPAYTHDHLARMLNPRSIAIVGATPRPGAFGERLLGNLGEYQGRIHLVNARYEHIGERPCHPSLADLPESPDLAVLSIGRDLVEALVLECIAAKVGGILIFASGYGETGKPERQRQQQRLSMLARESGIPIVGPNCIGVVNYALKSRATFTLPAPLPVPTTSAIGIVSQSGALGFGLEQAIHRGVSVSHMLNSGNSCDVDMADFVAYLADEPGCAAIAVLFEGMADPMRLMRACAYARTRCKPVVVYKIAVGERGAEAAMSHTGSMAGSHTAYRAAFERSGVVWVDKLEALIETAGFLAKAPRPKADGIAVMASSGGAAIMAADFADAHGVPMPQPGAAAQALLDRVIPDFGSARNPVDLTAQVLNDETMIGTVTQALLDDPAYGALVIPTILSNAEFIPRVPLWGSIARRLGKPIIDVWTTEWLQGPMSEELEREPGIAVFRSMDRAFAAIGAWHRLHARRHEVLSDGRRRSAASAAAEAHEALVAHSPGSTLAERAGKAVLRCYGVPVIGEVLAGDAHEAAQAASAAGFPVVLKIESPDIPHKTEAGGVRLNLRSEAEVREAFVQIMESARAAAPGAHIEGVLVQPMADRGVEIVVGGRIDPQFGPLVLVGLGGVMVELLDDTVLDLAPVDPQRARAMLDRLKGRALLDGFRGGPSVDREALADVISRISELLADQCAHIAELDVNPLICSGDRVVAVDALIVRTP